MRTFARCMLASLALVVLATAAPLAAPSLGSPAGATTGEPTPAVPHLSLGPTAVFSVAGVTSPGTPTKYDKVEVRRFGSPSATNVLVLVPGTNAGGGDFDIVGPWLAAHVPNLQVWAEMRREGALEDNSMLVKALDGKVSVTQAFDYYLGWLANPKITDHYQALKNSQYQFADQWGLAVAMGDLHNVIEKARDGGHRAVILGGHSLGGAEACIYPVWDFGGRAGYQDLAGIVGIDGAAGGSGAFGPSSITTVAQAEAAVNQLKTSGPWLDLLGNGLPWATGAFAETGALAAYKDPHQRSVGQQFSLLPSEFKPSVPVDSQAQLGYAFDASTSPAALSLIHIHSGHVATSAGSGGIYGWVDDGPTPIQDLAFDFSQEPIGPVDWYYPQRLSIDTKAASTLTETPAAQALGLRLTHESQVDVPLYVIQTSLGGANNGVAQAAVSFEKASKIPYADVVNESAQYSHLDPLLAAPSVNRFLITVVPFIEGLPGYRR